MCRGVFSLANHHSHIRTNAKSAFFYIESTIFVAQTIHMRPRGAHLRRLLTMHRLRKQRLCFRRPFTSNAQAPHSIHVHNGQATAARTERRYGVALTTFLLLSRNTRWLTALVRRTATGPATATAAGQCTGPHRCCQAGFPCV